MSKPVLPDTSSLVTFSVLINGKLLSGEYQVAEVAVTREVNRIASATIRIMDGSYAGLEEDFKAGNSGLFDPGKEVRLKAGYHSDEQVLFEGIIVKQSIKLSDIQTQLVIECREPVINMTLSRKNRVFSDKKDSEVVSDLIRSNGFSAKVKNTSTRHQEVVQYYCSDWDFMLLRAELCGHIILTDGKNIEVKPPDISGAPVIEVQNGKDLIEIDAEIDSGNQYDKVHGTGWDMSAQKVVKKTSGSVPDSKVGLPAARLSGVHKVRDYHLVTGANVPSELLASWTTGKLQRSVLSKVKGTILFFGNPKVKPGDTISVKGVSASFSGDYFVSRVDHRIVEGDWVTEAGVGLGFDSYAERMPDIDAPAASGMSSGIKGVHVGIVKKIHEDKEGQYRIRVTYPTVEQDNMPVWARVATFYATSGSGAFFLPEINDEVIVGFINEDPQQPVILGSLYSSKHKPAQTADKNNTVKSLVTKSKMKLAFDEKKKIITIETPGGNILMLDDDREAITLEDKNKNKVDMSKDGITLSCAKDFTVKSKGKIILDSSADVEVKATGNMKGEAMAVEFKGKTKFAAEGATAEVKGSAQTSIKGGIVMIN